jgi:hypothetical protein
MPNGSSRLMIRLDRPSVGRSAIATTPVNSTAGPVGPVGGTPGSKQPAIRHFRPHSMRCTLVYAATAAIG